MLKGFKKRILLNVTLLFGLTLGGINVAALSLPLVTQEQTNWCWVASGEMILHYYGITGVTQCTFYKNAKDTSSCPNNTGNNSNAGEGLYDNGVSSNHYSGALSNSAIYDQVSNYKPVYVNWQWTSGGGHAVVVKFTENYNFTDYLSYNDPWDGTSNTMTYTSFKGGSGFDRTWDSGLKDMWHYK